LHLPTRLALWQQLAVWSGFLLSSSAWAAPKPSAIARSHCEVVQASGCEVQFFRSRSLEARLCTASTPPHCTQGAAVLAGEPLQIGANTPNPSNGTSESFSSDGDVFSPSGSSQLLVDNTLFSAPSSATLSQEGAPPPIPPPTNTKPDPPKADPPKAEQRLNQSSNQPSDDPELGTLKLQFVPPPGTSTTSQSPTTSPPERCPDSDPELGCIRLQAPPPIPPQPARQASVYLLGRLDYFRSSNIFAGVDPVDDGLIRPGITLFASPAIGPNTYLVGAIDANLVRYGGQSQLDYNELRFRAGILQRLSPTMFGEFGWSNQQLYSAGKIANNRSLGFAPGQRFLNDNALRLELSRRDQLTKHLALSTFYQFRIGFAEPVDRSRIINSLIASLNYDVQPNLQLGLDYQFSLANFTEQPRFISASSSKRVDQYHQVNLRLTYTVIPNTQLSLYAGYSFGRSTVPGIDFDGLILGVSISTSVGLF